MGSFFHLIDLFAVELLWVGVDQFWIESVEHLNGDGVVVSADEFEIGENELRFLLSFIFFLVSSQGPQVDLRVEDHFLADVGQYFFFIAGYLSEKLAELDVEYSNILQVGLKGRYFTLFTQILYFEFGVLNNFHLSVSFFLLLTLVPNLWVIFNDLHFFLLLIFPVKVDVAILGGSMVLHYLLVKLAQICFPLELDLVLSVGVVADYGRVFFMVFVDLVNIQKKIDRLLFWSRMFWTFMASFVSERRAPLSLDPCISFFVLFLPDFTWFILVLKLGHQQHCLFCFFVLFNGVFFFFF